MNSAPNNRKKKLEGDGAKEAKRIKGQTTSGTINLSNSKFRAITWETYFDVSQTLEDGSQFVAKTIKKDGKCFVPPNGEILLTLENIPKRWTVSSLALIFDELDEISRSKMNGEAYVLALIETSLELDDWELNEVFVESLQPKLPKERRKVSRCEKRFFYHYFKILDDAGMTNLNQRTFRRDHVLFKSDRKWDGGRTVHYMALNLVKWMSCYIILKTFGMYNNLLLIE